MTSPISGTRTDLRHGAYHASIASIGASLRTLTHDGRDLVVPFDEGEMRPAHRGATLVPWPNRVVDGRYTWDDTVHQLPLTEPARGHALHGLGSWLDYGVEQTGEDAAILRSRIPAQTGYPFPLAIEVEFRLDDAGLHVSVTATNHGDEPAPYGTGQHPYLVAGEGRVDDWSAAIPADSVLTVTDDRLVPTGVTAVDGTQFDFRTQRVIADTFLDHAYTGLARDSEGITEVRVLADEGTGVAISWDAACPWVQVHTADRPDAEQSRIGLAVEPMTCPPDAFNSGTDLIALAPGASSTAGWSIRAL